MIFEFVTFCREGRWKWKLLRIDQAEPEILAISVASWDKEEDARIACIQLRQAMRI